jgi:hypothetical protein
MKAGKIIIAVLLATAIIIVGMLLLVSQASASFSPYEGIYNEYGNKNSYLTVTSTTIKVALSETGIIFRADKNMTASNIHYYMNSITGTWAGKTLRWGIKTVDTDTGKTTTNTWLGDTGNGYNDVVPVAGWNNISLNESVTLADGTIYAIAVEDVYSRLTTGVYYTYPFFGRDDIVSRGINGCYEEYDRAYSRSGAAGAFLWKQSPGAWLIVNLSTGVAMGNPYNDLGSGGLNPGVEEYRIQTFQPYDNFTSTELSLYLTSSSTVIPNAPLNVTINCVTDSTVVYSGTISPLLYGSSVSARWCSVYFSAYTFLNTKSYNINVSSSSTALRWRWCYMLTTDATPYDINSFSGISGCASERSGGSDYVYDYCDLCFKFNRYSSTALTVIGDLVNCTGTNDSSYDPIVGWTHWDNTTGDTTPITLFEFLTGCTGSHISVLTPTGYEVTATYTGASGGSTGTNFSMTSPNPANNSISQNGSYLNNNLSVQPGGLDCAVDVQYQNFTNLSEHLLTGGEESETYLGNYYTGQTFNITGDTITLDKVGVIITALPGAGNLTTFFITTTDEYGLPNASDILCKLEDVDTANLHLGWNFIDMPNVVLSHGTSYAFLMNWTNEGAYPSYLYNFSTTLGNYLPPPIGYVDIYPYGSYCWYADWLPSWMMHSSIDMYFWLWSVDYSWNSVVNLTYKWSPNNVDWYQFGFVQALWNGTWSCFNPNMTNASTQYWWSVQPEINGTVFPEQFYTFTTGTNTGSQLIPLQSADYRYGLLVGAVGLIAFSFRKKKKEENRKKK